MIFQPGDTLDGGKYIIKALLGRGGMGEVYLAHQTSVDRDVAIKVLYQKLTSESVIKRRFHREAKLMAKLNHPHCVTVYDFGETPEGILYIVMERLEGHTLSDHWADGWRTLHGLQANQFPNMFFLGFTQTAVTVNVPHALNEQARHVAYILSEARDRQKHTVEVSPEAEQDYVDEVRRLARVGAQTGET